MRHLSGVSLVAIDCTNKAHLAQRALELSQRECSFDAVKLLTDKPGLKHAVAIPALIGLEAYSKFCIRELHKHVGTSHAIVAQWDGYVIRSDSWNPEFLKYDYAGAPFQPSNIVGNGGMSLRSQRFLKACSQLPEGQDHPEDAAVSFRYRELLESQGLKFMPPDLARQFSIEGRSWNGKEWEGIPYKADSSFGFHSFLTPLPKSGFAPNIYSHAGDAGDIVYACAAIKALGEGVLFISPDNKHPHPLNSRWTRMGGSPDFVDNLRPLLEFQPYIWKAQYTHGHPMSCTHDLNRFRIPWGQRTAKDFHSILKLHLDAFNLPMTNEPWLRSNPVKIPGRPIVVNRTARYHNDKFPWDRLVKKHGHKMVFVGTAQEAELFQGFCPEMKVPFHSTANALELAEVIAGSTLFMGNQSMALAIAHGLGKAVLVEEWPQNANTHLERHNALYEVPNDWL
jgi:hypothetical protein